ncbi:MAG TPA: T9SS type A sorting domain-containing protein [Bacteroidia bacterium]|nr:T9SS type A sorting domain-containing protein [Bacteroidia bacterium]
MKKILFIIFVLSKNISLSTAQWVTIPDGNFVTKLTQLYPSCMNGNQMDTTCAPIIATTSISLIGLNISDLTGIQYFDNLIDLDCYGNLLISLPILPQSLVNLNCNSNYLTSLPQLPNSLKTLICHSNQLTSISSLPNSLNEINCANNLITTINALPTSLKTLSCMTNQLTSLSNLPDSLENLYCYYNLLTSLPALPNSLSTIFCNNNQLTTLPMLPNSLVQFNCEINLLIALPLLPNSLQHLRCHNNQLTSLPTLPNSLKQLLCYNNQITSLPTLPDSLQLLYCNSNQLTNIPNLPNTINWLGCSYNQITSLPQVPNQMYEFIINNNNISCLQNLPQVNGLNGNISNNPLTCVPNQTNYSLGLPLCLDDDPVNNPNYCQSVVNIVGYVYTDLNSNCVFDTTDLKAENIPVKLFDTQNNLVQLSYVVDGVYSFAMLQPDTYIIKIEDNLLPISIDCGLPNIQNVQLDSISQTIIGMNFPVVCDTYYDVKVQSVNSQGWVFPGQTHTLITTIADNETWFNLSCDTLNYSGTVSIQVTGPFNYVSPATGALIPQVSSNTFSYSINDFSSLTSSSFGLKFSTDTTAQGGDQICVHVEIATNLIDANPTNNTYDFCYNVVNSYDPNMKEVYPGDVLPGYNDWLTYTIHFQNTGNAPAFNIRLRDTLDTHLDLNTFEIIGSSHSANTTLYGNILAVRFNYIMLPDSTTDYDGSMGYFQYRIKPLPNLPQGTEINNTAYIYFDYNAPVVTNTTQNNFDFITGVKDITDNNTFVLYPNPSAGLFNFMDNSKIKTVEVYNLLGEKIISQTNQKQIDLRHSAKGIYFVKINGATIFKLVKEQ